MNGIMTYFRPASPLAVLAIGQMVVLALGGFDLSVGAIVTFVVLASSKFLANDPANALPNIVMLICGRSGRSDKRAGR
jgi:ribose transport system permease protein